MKFWLIAVGQRMPGWVQQGYQEYARRLPAAAALQLRELRAETRGGGLDTAGVLEREARRIEEALPAQCLRVVLDERGRRLSTEQLAQQMQDWRQQGRDIAFVIGGADGLAPRIKQGADLLLRLSDLTLPHSLARVLLAEQVYRVHSLLAGHPYHRGD